MLKINKMLKCWCLPFVALTAFLSSCEEGEHDYAYCVYNGMDSVVNLAYTITGDAKTYYDTLVPGQTDTLCWRTNVGGDNVWDVETSTQLYMISTISADINNKKFTDNIRLRSLWGGVKEENSHGVYTLNIVDSLFTVKNIDYYYAICNRTGKDINYTLTYATQGIAWPIPHSALLDSLAFGPCQSKQKYVADIYANAENVNQITLSAFQSYTATDTLYSNFNPNKASLWKFGKTVMNGDSVGVYTLYLDSDIFE